MTRGPRARASRYAAWDKRYLWHPFTQQFLWERERPIVVDSGFGAYFRDVDGRRYLDGVSSLWVNLHGHRQPSLDTAVRRQLSKIAHSTFLGLTHVPGIELGRALAAVAPAGLTRTFYSDNGATAVEVALKMAFQLAIETRPGRPPKTEFLALRGSYHGDTLGAVSVGSIGAFHSKFRPILLKNQFAMAPACFRCPYNRTGFRHRYRTGETTAMVPKPGDARPETGCRWECLGSVKKILDARRSKLAAAILEPVMQAATGMNAMPPGYAAGFQRLCRNAGVPVIADEVATGFGRTGRLFASELENLRPDFLCLAKGLTGGYSPLAATMTTGEVFRAFRAPVKQGRTFFHGHSYTGHPLGAAAALENLRLIQSTRMVERVRSKARLLKMELQSLEPLSRVGSIRQAGLMVGVELVQDKRTNAPLPAARRTGAAVCRRLLGDGIWLRPLGDTVVIMPPAVTSDSDVVRIVRRLK
ncbi:MAG: adenosylmethionine--8-amino-7-oxononanoate transaminase, partial [Elusimicrobia bacterium]|nr:adenosylmethionine--8-amino-7-oxononanoate transaminase [Elusimicrobiota bacterium]